MRRLIVFNHTTLDGYFVGPEGDFRWAAKGNDDPEYAAFVAENASAGGELLFGKITFEMMASYWPTPIADQHIVAQLAPHHLIDEYQMMIDPLALGKGRSMFDGIPEPLDLKLTKSRTFHNGKVFLCYEPLT